MLKVERCGLCDGAIIHYWSMGVLLPYRCALCLNRRAKVIQVRERDRARKIERVRRTLWRFSRFRGQGPSTKCNETVWWIGDTDHRAICVEIRTRIRTRKSPEWKRRRERRKRDGRVANPIRLRFSEGKSASAFTDHEEIKELSAYQTVVGWFCVAIVWSERSGLMVDFTQLIPRRAIESTRRHVIELSNCGDKTRKWNAIAKSSLLTGNLLERFIWLMRKHEKLWVQ